MRIQRTIHRYRLRRAQAAFDRARSTLERERDAGMATLRTVAAFADASSALYVAKFGGYLIDTAPDVRRLVESR